MPIDAATERVLLEMVTNLMRRALDMRYGKVVVTLEVEFTIHDARVTNWSIIGERAQMSFKDVPRTETVL